MHEWGDSGITAVLLAIGVALLLSFLVTQKARTRAARYKEIRRLQSVAAEVARREEEEAIAEYSSMVATRNPHCAVCSNVRTTRCSRCKVVRYCSSTCQAKHWSSGHKQECRPPEPSRSPGSSSNGSTNFSNICSTKDSSRSGIGNRSLSDESEALTTPAKSARITRAASDNGTLVKPKKVLFPYDHFVKYFNWEGPKIPPCGLLNCGNSCFANVVLQCLTHTRPLTAFLLEGTHGEECRRSVSGDWCFMCELQDHVWRVRNRQNPISPIRILSRIRNIGNHLGYGRQEDAHEFMRFAIDSMQSICLDEAGGEKFVDPPSQETTFIHHMFGGHLQSQVKCMQCSHESNRYESMMDLAVEIQGCVETLEDALTQFTAPEWLDGENKYKCDRCNGYVKARKRLTLHEAPNILTVALKRFQSGKFGKLNKRVAFPEILDVSPYMSGKGDRPPFYKLYAVVVHVDMLNASFFGHYICYVKDSQGGWYKVDDSKSLDTTIWNSMVKEVDLEKVMAQRAYMLFYTRSYARPPPFTNVADPPQPVDTRNTTSDRNGVLPSLKHRRSEEMSEGVGAQGLHAMVNFNQLLDYVDTNPETNMVSEHLLFNGEITTLHPSSWETQKDDNIELEDAECIASSSTITQTSPCMSSFTSSQGLWTPTQGFVCQVPESGSVEGTEYASYDPKSSLPDNFMEVSLQSSDVEKPSNLKVGKRRLDHGLSPLPSPKPLDTDQLPAWPLGSQGRPNPPAAPRSSATPITCSVLDDAHHSQQYESGIAGEPLPSETISGQHCASRDLVSLPTGESNLETEITDQILAETTGSGEEEIAARAKRQHVEMNRVEDPIARFARILEVVGQSNSSDLGATVMDWDATVQHPGSTSSGAIPGTLADPYDEGPFAHFRKSASDGQVVINQQASPQSLLALRFEGLGTLARREAEVDEPRQGTFVTHERSEVLQGPSQCHSGLHDEVLGAAPCSSEPVKQTRASQSVDQEQILINQGFSTTALEPSNRIRGEPAIAVQASNGSVSRANGAEKPQLGNSQKSKSTSKPVFALGFLNRSVGSKVTSSPTRSSKPSVETREIEEVDAKVGDCSCNEETQKEDSRIKSEVYDSEAASLAAVNNDTRAAPTSKMYSCGNCMICELCNLAHVDSQAAENERHTEGDEAPDTKDKNLAKVGSKRDHAPAPSKATMKNANSLHGVHSNGSSLNYPPVNISEEFSEKPAVIEVAAAAVPGRPANGKQKQGRNEACNCGSQRKWKKCCGKMGVIKHEVGRQRLIV